jgi:hypothetical protein
MRSKPEPSARFETEPRQPNPQLPVATVDSPAVSPGKEQDHFDSIASRGCLNGFATFASENFVAEGNSIAQTGCNSPIKASFQANALKFVEIVPSCIRQDSNGQELDTKLDTAVKFWDAFDEGRSFES